VNRETRGSKKLLVLLVLSFGSNGKGEGERKMQGKMEPRAILSDVRFL